MHTYRPIRKDGGETIQYHVGFEGPPFEDGEDNWSWLEVFDSEEEAARYVNYLNGGEGFPFPVKDPPK